MPSPAPTIRQLARRSGDADARRGNQDVGTVRVRPSESETLSSSADTRTATAVTGGTSLLEGEELIPRSQKVLLMLHDELLGVPTSRRAALYRDYQTDGIELKLRGPGGRDCSVFDVHMRRLCAFVAVEEEAKASLPQECRHRDPVGLS